MKTVHCTVNCTLYILYTIQSKLHNLNWTVKNCILHAVHSMLYTAKKSTLYNIHCIYVRPWVLYLYQWCWYYPGFKTVYVSYVNITVNINSLNSFSHSTLFYSILTPSFHFILAHSSLFILFYFTTVRPMRLYKDVNNPLINMSVF